MLKYHFLPDFKKDKLEEITEMNRWVQIAVSDTELISLLGSNGLVLLKVNGKNICVGREGESFFALNNRCPHAGGSLSSGRCEAGKIICPIHRLEYDIKSGRDLGGAGYHVTTYAVKSTDQGVYLSIPIKKWWRM